MNHFPDEARAQLAKLCGMFGSSHAGERDAAALAAHRLVIKHGATWWDVVAPVQKAPKTPKAPKAPKTPATPATRRAEGEPWRQTVQRLLVQAESLSRWEFRFLRALLQFPRISPKQRAILQGIADRELGADQ